MLKGNGMHAAAPALHFFRADDFVDRPIAAFHQHVGVRGQDQFQRRVFLEKSHDIHGSQRGNHGHAVGELIDGTVGAFV